MLENRLKFNFEDKNLSPEKKIVEEMKTFLKFSYEKTKFESTMNKARKLVQLGKKSSDETIVKESIRLEATLERFPKAPNTLKEIFQFFIGLISGDVKNKVQTELMNIFDCMERIGDAAKKKVEEKLTV